MSREKRLELKLARRKHRKMLQMQMAFRNLDYVLDVAKFKYRSANGKEPTIADLQLTHGQKLATAVRKYQLLKRWVDKH